MKKKEIRSKLNKSLVFEKGHGCVHLTIKDKQERLAIAALPDKRAARAQKTLLVEAIMRVLS